MALFPEEPCQTNRCNRLLYSANGNISHSILFHRTRHNRAAVTLAKSIRWKSYWLNPTRMSWPFHNLKSKASDQDIRRICWILQQLQNSFVIEKEFTESQNCWKSYQRQSRLNIKSLRTSSSLQTSCLTEKTTYNTRSLHLPRKICKFNFHFSGTTSWYW